MALTVSPLAEHYSICAQISLDDIDEIAALGFKTIINYRPDGEGGESQITGAALAEKASALGIAYVHIPVVPGQVTPENIAACEQTLEDTPKPIIGFCRTGKRATMLYQAAVQT